MPHSQAAAETGFFDQAHLTRHFKRTTGLARCRAGQPLLAAHSAASVDQLSGIGPGHRATYVLHAGQRA